MAQCGLHPTRPPDEARRRGRYAVENDEHVDVLVAPAVTTVDGVEVVFDEAEREGVLELARWFRRRYPTPIERLAYVRRAYARWRRAQGGATSRR